MTSEPICCPKFDPAPWQDKISEWNRKKFISETIYSFLFMPLNFGAVMKKLDHLATKAGASNPDHLCLTEHGSKWKMKAFLAVDRTVPGADNTEISGKFFSRVYEGPFQDTGKWCKDFDQITKVQGVNYDRMYMWYTTCPKCAKKYGKNYVVIFGRCPI